MRRISKLCLLSCLALGGWHNVLAAVACAHFECQPAVAATPRPPQASHSSHAAHDAPHDTAQKTRHCGARAESPGHAHEGPAAHARPNEARRGDDAGRTSAAVRADAPDAASPLFAPARGRCLHCAGRPAPSQTTASERRADEPRRVSRLAPHASHAAASPPLARSASAARPAPTQHAPPRTVPQYRLFSALLI